MCPFIYICGLRISTYGIIILAALLFSGLLIVNRAERMAVRRNDALYSFLFGVIGLFIGSKLLYIITQLGKIGQAGNAFFKNPIVFINSLFISGGYVFYGGLIGGIAMVYIYCRIFRLGCLNIFDNIAPAIPLAQAIGRIGCFMEGCCYGIPVKPPLGVYFSKSLITPHDISYFPIQLVDSAVNFALCAFLVLYSRRRRPRGRVIGMYLTCYAVIRFVEEFFRGDAVRGFLLGMSTSQFISLIILPAGLILLFVNPDERGKAGRGNAKCTAQ